MKRNLVSAWLGLGVFALASLAQGQEVRCVNGVYRAGCVGPNGAAAVTKPQPARPVYGQPGYRPPGAVVAHPPPVVVARPGTVVVARPGAVVVAVPPPPPRHIACVNGVYRAGCVGPNGAVVVNK